MLDRRISDEPIDRFLKEAEEGLTPPGTANHAVRPPGGGSQPSRPAGDQGRATAPSKSTAATAPAPHTGLIASGLGIIFVALAMLILAFLSRGERLTALERQVARLQAQQAQEDLPASVEFDLQQLNARVEGLATRLNVLSDNATGIHGADGEVADSPQPVESLGVDTGGRAGE